MSGVAPIVELVGFGTSCEVSPILLQKRYSNSIMDDTGHADSLLSGWTGNIRQDIRSVGLGVEDASDRLTEKTWPTWELLFMTVLKT